MAYTWNKEALNELLKHMVGELLNNKVVYIYQAYSPISDREECLISFEHAESFGKRLTFEYAPGNFNRIEDVVRHVLMQCIKHLPREDRLARERMIK